MAVRLGCSAETGANARRLMDQRETMTSPGEFGNQIASSQNPYFQTCWPPEAASKFENRGKARGRGHIWLPNFASCQASWQESGISRLVGYNKAGSLCHREEQTVIFRSILSN